MQAVKKTSKTLSLSVSLSLNMRSLASTKSKCVSYAVTSPQRHRMLHPHGSKSFAQRQQKLVSAGPANSHVRRPFVDRREVVGNGSPLSNRGGSRRQHNISVAVSAAKGFLKELQELKEDASASAASSSRSTTTTSATSTSRGYGSGAKLEYDTPLSILLYPHPKLRASNMSVTVFDEKVSELAQHMFKVMYETDGIGLAAPQVGVNVKMMVYNPTGEPSEKDQELVFINPKIVNKSKGQTLFEEGCLSFPNIMGDVKRPKAVTIEAQDLEGKIFRLSLDGLEARIFQHELDHLQGKLFHDRMAPNVFKSVKDQLQSLEKKFEHENPGVKYQSV